MQLPLTSRRAWRPTITLTLILGLTLTLWLTPTASPQLKRTAANLTSPPASQENVSSASPAQEGPPAGQARGALTPERVTTNLPPASCQSKWCDRVRLTHRIAHRLLAGLQRWERA